MSSYTAKEREAEDDAKDKPGKSRFAKCHYWHDRLYFGKQK